MEHSNTGVVRCIDVVTSETNISVYSHIDNG